MTHGSLFSGIGGAELAASWMGWNNLFHCEIDPFCRKDVVLLCYEKPPQFCHRHLVAKWLEKELNIKVEELKYK